MKSAMLNLHCVVYHLSSSAVVGRTDGMIVAPQSAEPSAEA